ncbi:hypothetical protein VAC73_002134, partial [Neisseria gonorrhoeae]
APNPPISVCRYGVRQDKAYHAHSPAGCVHRPAPNIGQAACAARMYPCSLAAVIAPAPAAARFSARFCRTALLRQVLHDL